jgi:type IV pilus assembly protein PilQ
LPSWQGSAFPAFAQNAIQSINSSQQAGSEVIRIEMTEPLAAIPAGFTVQAPPRIAIDLPGVTNGLGKSSVEINQGNLRSVSIAQSGERTRLVLNLKAPAGYRPRSKARCSSSRSTTRRRRRSPARAARRRASPRA